jgi:hypothetical protein
MSQVPCENGSEEGSSGIKPKRKRSAYEPPTHLDCKSGHPLHPDKKKRTCEVSEDVLKLASQIAVDVLTHTREYVTQPLCEVTHALVRDHALTCSEEIAAKFASIDAFIEWMNRIEPTPKKLNALQPAFKRYLSTEPHNMKQLQTQRSFLDTRETTPEHRSLVRLLSDGPKRETDPFKKVLPALHRLCDVAMVCVLRNAHKGFAIESRTVDASVCIHRSPSDLKRTVHSFQANRISGTFVPRYSSVGRACPKKHCRYIFRIFLRNRRFLAYRIISIECVWEKNPKRKRQLIQGAWN